jgi:hypothetical protein
MNTFLTMFLRFPGRRCMENARQQKNPLHNIVNLILTGASAPAVTQVVGGKAVSIH